MMLLTLVETAYRILLEQLEHTRLVLLHPRSQYRTLLVAQCLADPGLKTFYYAMGPDDDQLENFLISSVHDLATQNGLFGRHISVVPRREDTDLAALAGAFARDLAELSPDRYALILDEYDRSDSSDDIQSFMEKLIGQLPDNCRLIINSRSLPRLPWVSLIAQKHAVLLEDHSLVKQNFYQMGSQGHTPLEAFAFGPGHVMMNGREVKGWEGHLPRLLFFFALDRPIVTRSEICQAFWPDLDTDQAVNVFHVTKRRLHKALKIDVLVHDSGYYRVNPELAIHYDVMDFASSLVEARAISDGTADRIAAWQRVVDHYRGAFLQGHHEPWVTARRADYRAGFVEALTELAQLHTLEGHPEQALSVLQRALVEEPLQQALHREMMMAYGRIGRRSDAAAHYRRLQEDLRREKVTIEPETEQTYRTLMS